jgi:hypothetical protein
MDILCVVSAWGLRGEVWKTREVIYEDLVLSYLLYSNEGKVLEITQDYSPASNLVYLGSITGFSTWYL